MHIRSNILGGVAAIALMAAVPALAQSGGAMAAPNTPAASGAMATPSSDTAMPDSTATPAKSHARMHHRMHHTASNVDTSSEDATTAKLNQQQMGNPGSMASSTGSMSNDGMATQNMPNSHTKPATPTSDQAPSPAPAANGDGMNGNGMKGSMDSGQPNNTAPYSTPMPNNSATPAPDSTTPSTTAPH